MEFIIITVTASEQSIRLTAGGENKEESEQCSMISAAAGFIICKH